MSRARRENARAAAAAANATQRRRETTTKIIGGATVLALTAGITTIAAITKANNPTDTIAATPTENTEAAAPAGSLPPNDDYKYGIPVTPINPNLPTLALWEDLQCPACAAVEDIAGEAIINLAKEGKANVIWRTATFLDQTNTGDTETRNSSTRAAAALGCAADAGKAEQFHTTIFDNHPETEGDGYTDTQLIEFGTTIGLTGTELDTYTQCVTDGTYIDWASNSGAAFLEGEYGSTPYATINGEQIPNQTLANPAALQAALSDATN